MIATIRRVPRLLIQHCCEERSLVTIHREIVTEASSQGYVIDFDADWILFQLISDFQIDGWLLVRINDLTQLEYDGIDGFHQTLLEKEGIVEQVAFDAQLPKLESDGKDDAGLVAFLRQLPKGKVVILENELEEDSFMIGFLSQVGETEILLDYFDGEAELDPKPFKIDIEEITSVRLDSHYSMVYERHFERIQHPKE